MGWSLDESSQLIVDAIGHLSVVYNMANLAYVGGGFQLSGVHNVLEPMVPIYLVPLKPWLQIERVFFGPSAKRMIFSRS